MKTQVYLLARKSRVLKPMPLSPLSMLFVIFWDSFLHATTLSTGLDLCVINGALWDFVIIHAQYMKVCFKKKK